ncbi:PEP-CTERM protein-sorting domain-containing protein [Arsukibacterium tuosuense]|uniref:PEP-CTERM protein-sorting domain-containing protein n=1 Tax=Arsukibacterium tuosuense TaxID=1323745 RepID=A0A285JLD6_9GAMM|nr:PEP-CTERM sorting domain-containing protein [Arsukibacterium tuosuense]SNY60617.1 PEP-CTERM protein-sorting domain-containing protein [Arsukibacterium tuosuense]
MKLLKLAAAAALLGMAGASQAAMIITDGNVSLGVDDLGQLNVSGGNPDVTGLTGVGLRYISDGVEYESTYHGCLCEGWGVAADGTSGSANNASGIGGLSLVSFDSTATTATSVTTMGGLLQITHDFALASETDNLFRVAVTIENISGADIANLLYRRTFDWDTSPTPFNEFVTIGGTAGASAVLGANDNGFCSSDPLVTCNPEAGNSGDFTAGGPDDIGSNFDFDFGALLTGESYTFEIYYGGADNRNAALSALASVGAEVYSLGWSGTDVDQDGFGDASGAITPTYIFGFSGVGGTVVIDPDDPVDVPAPASLLLFATGFMALFARRQRYAKL